MPARHYRVEYTEDDTNYTLLAADEAPGLGKTQTLTGLGAGTHTGKLRLIPLSGDTTPVVSLPFTFQVGTVPLVEPVVATASATATIADVMTLRDNLLAAIGVIATPADIMAAGDQLAANATATATAADIYIMSEQLLAAVTAADSAADVQAMAEQLVAAVAADASVVDYQPGLVVDNLITSITAETTAADVQAMAEQLVAAAGVQATQSDGLTMHENVTAAATAVATVADVRAMLESVLAAATAQATVADTYTAGGSGGITENFDTAITQTYAGFVGMSDTATVQGWTIANSGTDPGMFDVYDVFVGASIRTYSPGFAGNSLSIAGCRTEDGDANVIAESGFKVTKTWTGPFASGTFSLKYFNTYSGANKTIKVNGVSVGAVLAGGIWQTASIQLTDPASITLEIEYAPTVNVATGIKIDSITYQ